MSRPTSVPLQTWLGWGVRVVISVLFLKAGWDKVADPGAFALSIQGYRMVPDGVTVVMTWVLPWLEIWCAVALWVTPLFRRSAWIWITLMLVAFTGAKTSAVLRGLDISCGCTSSETPLTWSGVVLNLLWLTLAVTGTALDRRWPR